MTEPQMSLVRRIVCWVFGECWRLSEARRENERLRDRLDRVEQQLRVERYHTRPSDVFRIGRYP